MAKVRKSKAQEVLDPPSTDKDIFAHFAEHASGLNGPATPDKKTAEPDNASLLARLDALESTNRELRATAALPMVPVQTTPTRDFVPDPKTLKLDLSGLPDPALEVEAYQRELSTRINAFVEAKSYAATQEITSKTEQTNASARLWNGFKGAYPDWAEHEELVGSVAARVATEMQQRGVDVQRYMYQHSEKFYEDVANRLNDRYGALIEDPVQDEPAARTPKKTKATDPNEDDGRSAGIFGGQESGGKPTGSGKQAGGSDMIEDLQKIQRSMGIF